MAQRKKRTRAKPAVRKSAARKKEDLSPLLKYLPADPASLMLGVGRRPMLTRELVFNFAEELLTGAPVTAVAKSNGVQRQTVRAWRNRGDEDLKAGKETLYAVFSTVLDMAEGKVEVRGFWGAVSRGLSTGKKEDVAAGQLAIKALGLRYGRRYMGWRAKLEAHVHSLGPSSSQMDLSRLSGEELAELQRLTEKATRETDSQAVEKSDGEDEDE